MTDETNLGSKTAPLVVFGGIFAIAICTVSIVLIGRCTADESENPLIEQGVPIRDELPTAR